MKKWLEDASLNSGSCSLSLSFPSPTIPHLFFQGSYMSFSSLFFIFPPRALSARKKKRSFCSMTPPSAHKNCQSGSDSWSPRLGDVRGTKSTTVNFNPAFSRKPLVIASFNYVHKTKGGSTFYFQIHVYDVSPTKMKLLHNGHGIFAQQVYWLACQ